MLKGIELKPKHESTQIWTPTFFIKKPETHTWKKIASSKNSEGKTGCLEDK